MSWTTLPAEDGSTPPRRSPSTSHAPFHELGSAADAVRRRRFAGTEHIATYLIDRNINYTNVCVTACRFCAFYRPPKSEEGWVRSIDEIVEPLPRGGRARSHADHAAGRPSPRVRGSSVTRRCSRPSRPAFPQLALHSLGASEVVHIGRVSELEASRGHPPAGPQRGSTASPGPARRSWWRVRAPRSLL